MTTILETERLRLREFARSDLDALAMMMADEDQMWLYPRSRSRDETKEWIDRSVQLYETRGFGFWLMESVEASRFLGYCGIRPRIVEGVEETEMGWHTLKAFWGQGFATEAAAACRDLAFSDLAATRLVALIDSINTASVRVAEKIGMHREKEAVVDQWPCLIYAVKPSPSP